VIVPLAVSLGGMIALFISGLPDGPVAALVRRPSSSRIAITRLAGRSVLLVPASPLGRHLAGRAPPRASEA